MPTDTRPGPLDALANEHRRRILVDLLPSDSPDASRLQGPEDVTPDDVDPAGVHARLVHVHLPKLEAAGLVQWDRERGAVERGPRFEAVRPLVRRIEGGDVLVDGLP